MAFLTTSTITFSCLASAALFFFLHHLVSCVFFRSLSFFFLCFFFFFFAFCFKGCSCVCFLVVVFGGFSLEGGIGISFCFVFKLSCMKFSTVFYSVFVFSVYFWFVLFLFSLLGFCFCLIFSFSFLIFSAFEGGCFTLFCFRGHWRSGPRHLSPRTRVCAQEWHSKDIHSHIHSHTPMHTPPPPPPPKKKSEKKNQLTKHYAFVYCSSSCPVWSWATFMKFGRCSSGVLHFGGLLA